MTTQTKTLYDRLGGIDAISTLTESWVARVAGDDRANKKFVRTDVPRLKKEVIDQLCEATGVIGLAHRGQPAARDCSVRAGAVSGYHRRLAAGEEIVVWPGLVHVGSVMAGAGPGSPYPGRP